MQDAGLMISHEYKDHSKHNRHISQCPLTSVAFILLRPVDSWRKLYMVLWLQTKRTSLISQGGVTSAMLTLLHHL